MPKAPSILIKGLPPVLWLVLATVLSFAEPTPSPELNTVIGDSFSRLKESIHADGTQEDSHLENQATPDDSEDVQAQDAGADPSRAKDDDPVADSGHDSSDHGETVDPLKEPHVEMSHENAEARSPFTGDIEKADFLQQNGDYGAAINTYLNLLNIADVPALEHKKALFGLAETYYKRGSLAQSVSLLDQFLKIFPEDERRAEIQFQIGLLYREMRLYPEAVTAFYRVLNSIVVTGDVDLPKYLSLARRSQFEIARSHFYAEEWDQALVILDRIELFELNPTDRESLLYYKAHATLRMGDREEGLRLVQQLLRTYPSSPLVPEMLYTKADILARMQQNEDAVSTLMELLEFGGLPNDEAADQWGYWRQQAGNQFANRYYENQDFLAALRLYQGIAVLDDRAQWQLPIIYQMGLCFEKLGMYDRAVESLQFVAQGIEELSETEDKSRDAALNQLLERANWRLNMLTWRAGLERDRIPMLANKISDLESEEE